MLLHDILFYNKKEDTRKTIIELWSICGQDKYMIQHQIMQELPHGTKIRKPER
jgi:hypothetical protein